MKQNTITILTLVSISLLLQSCGPSKEVIQLTTQAEAYQKVTQDAVVAGQTAVLETQTAMEAEKAALAMTQTAVAIPPIQTPVPVSASISCPFYVYQDWGADANYFVPEGYMGDISDIKLDDNYKLDPERPNVIQIAYKPHGAQQWVGVYWWAPGTDWGNKNGGFDISCATRLTFWARGEKGGEKAEFKVGGIKGTYSDSLQPALSSGPITLTDKWVQYTIDLTGQDLSHIMGGFVWVTNKPANPNGAIIYVDDIKFEQ
jgi:hypothetical protein